MTGPDGEKYHGWWRVIAVDPPHSLEIEDGFADDSGRPNDDLPTTSIEVRLTAATATRSRALSRRRARRSRRPARRWLTRRRSRLTPEEARRAFPPRRKLTDEQAREVTRLYAETDTPVEAIARQFSIGQASVYRLAQQQRVPVRQATAASAPSRARTPAGDGRSSAARTGAVPPAAASGRGSRG